MEDLALLANLVTSLEQRVESHLTGDRAKDNRILELTDRVAALQAQLDAVNDPNRNEQYAALLQRLAITTDRL